MIVYLTNILEHLFTQILFYFSILEKIYSEGTSTDEKVRECSFANCLRNNVFFSTVRDLFSVVITARLRRVTVENMQLIYFFSWPLSFDMSQF